jgi:ribosome-associated translation inhibitor RaiA
MKYLFVAPNLSGPTFETLQETTFRMFKKVESILEKFQQTDCTIKVSVTKEGHNFFRINVEILNFKRENPIVVTKDSDLRKAVAIAASKVKNQIIEKRKRMQR